MTATSNAPATMVGSPTTQKAGKSPTYKPTMISSVGKGIELIPRQNEPKFQLMEGACAPVFHDDIMVSPDAHRKMCTYIRYCTMEIGWLGTVIDYGRFLFIDDVFLLKQEVTGGSTSLSEDDMVDFVTDFLNDPPEGLSDNEALDVINSVRMWGHSHVEMGVTPSGTDERTMHVEFARSIPNTSMPFFVRAIGNKKGDLVFDIFYYDKGISIRDVPWMIGVPDFDEEGDIIDEMHQKLSYKPSTVKYPATGFAKKPPQGQKAKSGNQTKSQDADDTTEEVVNLPAVPGDPNEAYAAAEALFHGYGFDDYGAVGMPEGTGWDIWGDNITDDPATVRGAYDK